MQHVMPLNDLMTHHESITCPCNPKCDGELVIHNAFDGREFKEMSVILNTLNI